MTHVILNPGTDLETLQLFMPSDSTSSDIAEGTSATVLVTSGLGDFDYGGCFDNYHGFEQVYITIEIPSVPPPPVLGSSVVWGQLTGVDEANAKSFDTNWTLTDGGIESTGNPERLITYNGGNSISEIWELGAGPARIILNKYQAGVE
jgi:hypothetical protein